jgi:tetratricopeptide (TPR) repeat protein
MRRTIVTAIAIATAIAAFVCGASGHGDVHESIARVSGQIAAAPTDAQLYMNRGALHGSHGDWPAALADFEKAGALSAELRPVAQTAHAEILLLSGKPASALSQLDALIPNHPKLMHAYEVRARCLLAEKQPAKAAEDFHRVLDGVPRPEPSLVLDCARAEAAAGQTDEALRTLDGGISKLGPIVTLVEPAIGIEEKAGRFDAALARLEKLMTTLPRKERWLARKAALLEKAGRTAEARTTLEQARAALETLPPERRYVAAMVELSRQITEHLARLGKQ